MLFVLMAMLALFAVSASIWYALFRKALMTEHIAAARRADEEEFNRRLGAVGEPLHCMGCDTTFLGPLQSTGCPHCHVVSLVVTRDMYEKAKSESVVFSRRRLRKTDDALGAVPVKGVAARTGDGPVEQRQQQQQQMRGSNG